MADYNIAEIEGIGSGFAAKLQAAGIGTTAALLEACKDAKGRKAIAEKTGIGEARLLKWVNMADLMRIEGVDHQCAELLEAAGVDTVKELKGRNAANLAAKVAEVNGKRKLTRTPPDETQIAGWIAQAKIMPAMISHTKSG